MTDIFRSRYYKINKYYLSAIGLWPYQSRRGRFVLLPLAVCLGLNLIPPQIIAIVKCWDEPEVIADLTPVSLVTIAFVIRLIGMIVNSDKILQIFQRIEISWISMTEQRAIHILRNYAEVGRRLTIAYLVGTHFVVLLFLGKPFVPRILKLMKPTNETLPKMLPFPFDYYGFNVDTYYYYLLTFMSIGIINYMVVIAAADTMFLIHIQHACGLFAVVGHRLQRMGNNITEEYLKYSHPKLDPAFRYLTACIEKHRDAIEFSKLLETSYRWSIFISVGTGMLTISYAGVQTVLMMEINPKASVRHVAFEIGILIVIFCCFFVAQRLLDHSQQIGEYLCQAEWYKTSLATQKLLNLVIMRAHAPCQLTAGTFMVMSLENFTLVLKASLSYFTVIRSTQ